MEQPPCTTIPPILSQRDVGRDLAGKRGEGRRGVVGESDAKDEDADRLSAPSISCKPPALPPRGGWRKFVARMGRVLVQKSRSPHALRFTHLRTDFCCFSGMLDDNMQYFFSFFLSSDPFFQVDRLCWFICPRPRCVLGK